MRRLLFALTVLVVVLPAGRASAGTYDVVSCHAPGAEMRNLAWTFETFNATDKPAPPASRFVLNPASPDACESPIGVSITSQAAKQTVMVDDGAAWVFRAPAGTTVKRMQVWRNTATAASVDDAGTGGVENGWWTLYARAGDRIAGQVVLAAETCPGNAPTAPDTVYCRRGGANFPATVPVTYDVGRPVVSWSVQCTGPATTSLCFTGNGSGRHAHLHLQGAVVTVDDPVAPAVDPGLPADGVRRTNESFTATAADSAGIRSLRVLVDGVARVDEQYACDFRRPAPCPTSAAKGFDLAGLPDGRHTLTTIAEDAASNVSRSERSIEVDGTPPVIDRVPVTGRRVSVLVSDVGSGIASGTIAVRDATDAPYTALKTTLRGGRLTATVPGSFSMSSLGIQVSVVDRAGNALTCVVTSMSLSTRVGRGSARKVRNERAKVGYGRAVTLSGRLTTVDGTALGGQPVVVTGVERRTGASAVELGRVSTDARGRFSVRVPAGPSRDVSVRFPGAEGLLHRVRSVSLRVPARATIRAARSSLRGHGKIRFSGRLRALGAKLPPGGKIVDLEASYRGRWSPVDTTRTRGSSGAWSATAEFSGRPGRYPVRLRIRREASFPYDLGYSASVVVRVR
jgi:hypothetical protein